MKNTFLSDKNPNLDIYSLSKREWDVLLLLAKDISNKEIAGTLYLANSSIKAYKRRIGEKLLISGRGELERFARKNSGYLGDQYRRLF